jgi:hypothetical protein
VCGKFHFEAEGKSMRVVAKKIMVVSNRDGGRAPKVVSTGVRRNQLPDDPIDLFDRIVTEDFSYRVTTTQSSGEEWVCFKHYYK